MCEMRSSQAPTEIDASKRALGEGKAAGVGGATACGPADQRDILSAVIGLERCETSIVRPRVTSMLTHLQDLRFRIDVDQDAREGSLTVVVSIPGHASALRRHRTRQAVKAVSAVPR